MKKKINYAESDDDDEEDIIPTNGRANKRRKTLTFSDDEDDAFKEEDADMFSDLGKLFAGVAPGIVH